MKSALGVVCLGLTLSAFAACDLHRFNWPCELPAATKPVSNRLYSVYCNNLPVYVSKEAYLEVMRYQHANVNMDLMVEGEFVSGPCIPGSVVSFASSTFMRETPFGQRHTPAGVYK